MACKRSTVRSRLAPPLDDFFRFLSPHRLEAQDTALSRRRQGFESPWGRHTSQGFATERSFVVNLRLRGTRTRKADPRIRADANTNVWPLSAVRPFTAVGHRIHLHFCQQLDRCRADW